MSVKIEQTPSEPVATPARLPEPAALAAYRAWFEGLSARDAVLRYLGEKKADGASARGILGKIRTRLVRFARDRHRDDLATLLANPAADRPRQARAVVHAIDVLRDLPPVQPLIGDDVATWLSPRTAAALHAQGVTTLAALTVRIPRRRMWWTGIPGLGAAGAKKIETFFAEHPELTERARALVAAHPAGPINPWERLSTPRELDGSRGTFRAPLSACTLGANNDYGAVGAWLNLHESPATQRAYRKEAERLLLWAVVERGKALSSLTNEDATAYRSFLRNPAPRGRWVGTPSPRNSPEWRPFAGALSPRSVAYALSVLKALFRWLSQQCYVLANPFAGVKVRGGGTSPELVKARVFSAPEWSMVQTVSEGLEWSYGWQKPAAQRIRFVLDFAYGTGLRASEFVDAELGNVETDARNDHWLHVVGKGSKIGKAAIPELSWVALNRYLSERQLPTTPAKWNPKTPLLGKLDLELSSGITGARLWAVMKRFFAVVADVVRPLNPGLAEKLVRASPHWMRHTHATHALENGAGLTTVRDNLRHASLSTTSIYLHDDDVKRAKEMGKSFPARPR